MMNFQCGDQESLISYLYGECDTGERETVDVHVAECEQCASVLAELGATREALASWTPPAAALGFHLTPSADSDAGRILELSGRQRPRRWWSQPLPAWAQAAAAALIFAAGMSAGMARTAPGEAGASAQSPQSTAATSPVTATAPAPVPASPAMTLTGAPAADAGPDLSALEARLRRDLERRLRADLDERLRSGLADLRRATVQQPTRVDVPGMVQAAALVPVPASAGPGSAPTLDQVRTMIEASEARLARDLAVRTTRLFSGLNAQRVNDMQHLQAVTRQQWQGVGVHVQQQQEILNHLVERVVAR